MSVSKSAVTSAIRVAASTRGAAAAAASSSGIKLFKKRQQTSSFGQGKMSSSSSSSSTRFGSLEEGPLIEPFVLTAKFREDKAGNKVNAGQGSYRTNESQPFILPIVEKIEEEILADLKAGKINHEYLPVLGLPAFRDAACRFALGASSKALKEDRVLGVQCLSGTGALRVGAEFLATRLNYRTCYYSEPTWENHRQLFRAAGFTDCKSYRYWDATRRAVDFAGMLADLDDAPEDSVVILHACAHNPTGMDLTAEQWGQVAEVVRRRRLFPFMDCAYQGFASGDPESDGAAVRAFDDLGLEFFVAQSFAKNFGLYNERVGNLTVVISDASAKKNLASQFESCVRAMYSNPPAHGAHIVTRILTDPQNYKFWKSSVEEMSGRIRSMRSGLRSRLESLGAPGTWSHITEQIGMFSYSGLTPEQTRFLKDERHVYFLRNGRINMSGLTEDNLDHVAESIVEACKKFPAAT